jgi:hypothetical protein
MSRRLDERTLPRPLLILLVAIALAFAFLWARQHGFIPSARFTESLRGERFRLRHVDFTGLAALAPADLWRLARVANGTPLVDLDPDEIEARLAANPRVERVRAARLPPDRLVIGVTERVPLAQEAASGLGLDAEGARFPLEPGESERLPVVSGEPERALPVLEAARTLGVNVASVETLREDAVRVRTLGRTALLVVGRDPRASLADWRQLADSGLVEETGAQEVDLRFRGNPVLRDFPKKAQAQGAKAQGGGHGETR